MVGILYLCIGIQPVMTSYLVRGGIFQLLGTLCEVYPEFMTCHSERLIDIFMRTLKSEMGTKAKKKPDMPVIGGCLRGLCSYLVNFSQSVAEGPSGNTYMGLYRMGFYRVGLYRVGFYGGLYRAGFYRVRPIGWAFIGWAFINWGYLKN